MGLIPIELNCGDTGALCAIGAGQAKVISDIVSKLSWGSFCCRLGEFGCVIFPDSTGFLSWPLNQCWKKKTNINIKIKPEYSVATHASTICVELYRPLSYRSISHLQMIPTLLSRLGQRPEKRLKFEHTLAARWWNTICFFFFFSPPPSVLQTTGSN